MPSLATTGKRPTRGAPQPPGETRQGDRSRIGPWPLWFAARHGMGGAVTCRTVPQNGPPVEPVRANAAHRALHQ